MGDWQLPPSRCGKCPFRVHGGARGRVIRAPDISPRVRSIIGAALDADDALGDGRQADLRIEAGGDARFQTRGE